MLNEKFFAQNLIYDDWWMFILQAGMALALVLLFLKNVRYEKLAENKPLVKFTGLSSIILTVYIIIAIHMGGREIGFYSAPLVSLQNYTHVLALCLITALVWTSKKPSKSKQLGVFVVSLLLLFISFKELSKLFTCFVSTLFLEDSPLFVH